MKVSVSKFIQLCLSLTLRPGNLPCLNNLLRVKLIGTAEKVIIFLFSLIDNLAIAVALMFYLNQTYL